MAESPESTPVVRAALGWRAREVERQSTAPVRFRDAAYSKAIFAEEPVRLVYGDAAHGFTLPPGRYLRLIQTAGRVHSISAAPQIDPLPRAEARALLLRLAAAVEAAGWRRAEESETSGGANLSLAQAADRAFEAAATRTFGLTDVGTWRAPRPAAPWAALPPGAVRNPAFWDGLEVSLSLNTLEPEEAGRPGSARFAVNVDVNDQHLRDALTDMEEARQRRLGDVDQTLTDWDRQPDEPVRPDVSARARDPE